MPIDVKAALQRADEALARSKAARAAIDVRMNARRAANKLPPAGASPRALSDAIRDLGKTVHALRRDVDETELRARRRKFIDPLDTLRQNRISEEVGRIEARKMALERAHKVGAELRSARVGNREYAQKFASWARGRISDGELKALAPKARSSTLSLPDGGFLVPEEMEKTIERVLQDVGAMRGLASVRSVSSPVFKKPVGTGGSTSGWVGEEESRPETSTPKLEMIEIRAHELYAMPAATQVLLDDAEIDVEAWLTDETAIEFLEREGDAFINGSGVSRPQGLLTVPTKAQATYVDYDPGADFGKIGYIPTGAAAGFASANPADVFQDCVYLLKEGSLMNARWLMNRATAALIRKFKIGDGQYLWEPGLQAGTPSTILGYPVSYDDFMPGVAANKFAVAFGDFGRTYQIVDRVGMTSLRDPYSVKGHVLFYTRKRVGGGVIAYEHMKFIKIATS